MNDDSTEFPLGVVGFLATSGMFLRAADHIAMSRSISPHEFPLTNLDPSPAIDTDASAGDLSAGDLRAAFSTNEAALASVPPFPDSNATPTINATDPTEASSPSIPRSLPEAGLTR